MAKLPNNIRAFDDYDATRENIYSGVLDALNNKTIEDKQHSLTISDVKFKGVDKYSMAQQKDALLKNNNLTRSVVGTWTLKDKATDKVIGTKTQPLMRVPVLTERGTVINNGSEYTFTNQSRLKYGVYTRKKQSGEYESQFNVKPGTGSGFRVWMEPKTGQFKVKVRQGNVPAYQFFKLAGVKDEEMAKAWGPELYEINKNKIDKKAHSKIYSNFLPRFSEATTEEEKAREFRELLSKHEIDPYVAESTLGVRNTKTITPELLLQSTNKLLRVSKGEDDEDDRDHLRFSTIHSAEDLIRERIDKDAGKLSRQILTKVRYDKNLGRLRNNLLDPYMSSLMHSSGLMTPLEETNPLQLLEQANRITKFGEGGIGDDNAILDSARDVSMSQLGFIDPIAGPESGRIGVDTRAAYKTFKGKDGNLYGEFLDNKSGKTKYLNPMDLHGRVLAFPDQKPDINGEVVVSKDGHMDRVPLEEVDYTVPTSGHMLSANLNNTNMVTGFSPSRAFYSGKYHSQYIPQAHGEAPLVQTMSPDGENTYQEMYGKAVGSLSAPVSGKVVKVTDEFIKVKDSNGETHTIETVKNFPFNRLTHISYTASVKQGDTVKEGGMLASSNFIDPETGAINTGQNLSVAIMPYKGKTFEDAYVISESAAKRMTTEKMFEKKQDIDNDNKIDKKKYVSLFPTEFSKKKLENIDDNGVIKKGTIVEKGDPIILSTRPKTMSTQDVALGKLHKVLSQGNVDTSVTWDHEAPGEVIDIAKTRKGMWKVNIKSVSPAAEGDKLCFLPGHEILTIEGWVKVENLRPDMWIATREFSSKSDSVGYVQLKELHVYNIDEKVCRIDTPEISLKVTDNHKMFGKYKFSVYNLLQSFATFHRFLQKIAKTCQRNGLEYT